MIITGAASMPGDLSSVEMYLRIGWHSNSEKSHRLVSIRAQKVGHASATSRHTDLQCRARRERHALRTAAHREGTLTANKVCLYIIEATFRVGGFYCVLKWLTFKFGAFAFTISRIFN